MKKLLCLCSLVGLTPFALCAKMPEDTGGGTYPRLSAGDTLQSLLAHPALAPFARHMLPWDGQRYNPDMKLQDVSSLMPYHSNVRPAEITASVNRLISDAQTGKSVFFDFYSQEQKERMPAKNNTGLFFFRGSPGAPFAVICPGGGFAYVASLHEGFPLAEQISKQGFNVFVLKYRAGSGQWAVEDLAAALEYIFKNANALDVSTKNYSLWGGSAGARMAAAVGSYGTAVFGAEELPKPAAVIMAYTGQSSFTPQDPPTFIAAAQRDFIAPADVMKRRADGLKKAGVHVEFHVYPEVRHGFGLGTQTAAQGWLDNAVTFWKKFIKQEKKK